MQQGAVLGATARGDTLAFALSFELALLLGLRHATEIALCDAHLRLIRQRRYHRVGAGADAGVAGGVVRGTIVGGRGFGLLERGGAHLVANARHLGTLLGGELEHIAAGRHDVGLRRADRDRDGRLAGGAFGGLARVAAQREEASDLGLALGLLALPALLLAAAHDGLAFAAALQLQASLLGEGRFIDLGRLAGSRGRRLALGH